MLTLPALMTMVAPSLGTEIETKFLIPDKMIFQADFDEGENPGKPNWQLRKSNWEIFNGALRGVNAGGNGPFIRFHSKQNGGVLPEDYIIRFSFMTETRKDIAEKDRRKIHPKYSIGHRFSFGHYAAKYQWRGEQGMDLAIGHGHAIEDKRFHIEKGRWYHVTAEIRGDEILVWFQDGPAWYMQHDHFRSKPQGFEFFTHITEAGYLDNLEVWSLAEGTQSGWEKQKAAIVTEQRSFVSSEHPDFVITKPK